MFDEAIKQVFRLPGPHRKLGLGVPSNASIDGLYHLSALVPDASTMIELGSAWGESTFFFWKTGKFKKIYAVDPFMGRDVDNFDEPQHLLENVVIPSAGLVEHVRQKSADAATLFPDKTFDLVYVDAAHDYENVKRDIIAYINKVKPGGIIAGHDYSPPDFPGCVAAVNEIFGVPDKVFTDTSWMKRIA